MDDRLDGVTVAHDQGADPLRGADLMTGDGDEGAADVRERYGDLAERLDGVRMETDVRRATSLGQRRHRLDRADLVVHPHHAHHGHAARYRRFDRRFLYHTGRADGKDDLLTAQAPHRVRGGENGLVLGGGHRHARSEEHTSELQSPCNLVCRLLLEKKKTTTRAEILIARTHDSPTIR